MNNLKLSDIVKCAIIGACATIVSAALPGLVKLIENELEGRRKKDKENKNV